MGMTSFEKKIIKITIAVVATLALIIAAFIYFAETIRVEKITENIETVEGPKEMLKEEDTEIYCICRPTTSAPEWVVVGKNGVMFEHDDNPWEEIVVTGNAPRELNYQVSGNSNVFILRGHYLGVQKVKLRSNSYTFSCKVFNIEEWSIRYPIDRRTHSEENRPKDGLSLGDILDEAGVPSYELVEDDDWRW